MTKCPQPSLRPAPWILAASLCLAANAAAQPVDPGTVSPTDRNAILGRSETPQVGGNYDYFSAYLRTDLAAYLGQVTNRHASERVWALFWEGKYTEPLGDCEYVLARFPNHPRALHLIGEIAKATNQISLAIGYFENALRLYPQYAFTHAQYGHFLIDIGVIPAGIKELREALRLDPKQFQAKAWLAEALAAHPGADADAPPGGSPEAGTPGGAPAKAPGTR